MKPYLVIAGFVIGFVLILPAAIVFLFSGKEQAATGSPIENETTEKVSVPEPASTLSVSVYRAQEKTIETVPLDQYVIGVVASEMPANFELEALKAQALAARTYIVNYLLNPPDLNLPKGAEVTDTVMNQVYKDDKELKALWGSDFGWKMAKITKAVEATMGQIITYHDQPITVAFFSTSNGYTESSEAYWQSALPYLKSVPSPWDRNSPKFSSTESIPVSKVDQKLGVDIEKAGSIGNVVKSTPGHRVGKVKIAGEVFSGREVREKLGLRSTDFKMKREGDQVVITTKGWGHGVGMSQYGANGMAKQGKEYRDIIKYYYQGVSISNLHAYTAQLTAKK